MKKLYWIFIISLAFSCQDPISPNSEQVDQLIFGLAHGECIGKCFRVYQLNESKLYQDTTVNYLFDYEDFEFNAAYQLTNDKFEIAQNLLHEVPSELLITENKKFGCPDCYDQGGIYVEIINESLNRRFVLDTDDTNDQSEEVRTFKQALQRTLQQLAE